MPKRKRDEESTNAVSYHSVVWNRPDEMSEDDFRSKRELFQSVCRSRFENFIFQLERGKKKKRLHYQCFAHTSPKIRSGQLEEILWETFKGVRVKPCSNNGVDALKRYCMKKDETYVDGPWMDENHYDGWDIPKRENLFPFQMEILALCEPRPDDRTINYVYEEIGSKGKTKLQKFILWHKMGAFLSPADHRDLMYLVCQNRNKKNYFVNIPRSIPKGFCFSDLFSALEAIKDGIIQSTKYKCETVLQAPAHVWVFSNQAPWAYANMLSKDRWRYWTIKENSLCQLCPEKKNYQTLLF